MESGSLQRGFLFAGTLVAFVAGIVHCSSSHPPLATKVGDDPQVNGVACYKIITWEGGCNLPVYYATLPVDVPIKDNDLPDEPPDGAAGGGFCFGGPVGESICPESQQRTFTCIAPGVFQVTDTPNCKWPDGGTIAGDTDAGADPAMDAATTEDSGVSDAGTD